MRIGFRQPMKEPEHTVRVYFVDNSPEAIFFYRSKSKAIKWAKRAGRYVTVKYVTYSPGKMGKARMYGRKK